MTYSVYQPWDPLKVCVVGKSYPPDFYNFIENKRLQQLFKQIATETAEDFDFLADTLTRLGVKVIRPNVPEVQIDQYLTNNKRIPGPVSMTPRDQMIMIGDKFLLFPYNMTSIKSSGRDLEETVDEKNQLSEKTESIDWWKPIIDEVKSQGNQIISKEHRAILERIPANGITRIGKDIYFGFLEIETEYAGSLPEFADPELIEFQKTILGEYRHHWIKSNGHLDGMFCPVKPGLILSIFDTHNYAETFPGWEVVYLEGESWFKVKDFLDLKKKNAGRWWIKGREHDDELINYVETWLGDWVGYCEESVFDVNILVVDQQNVIVSGYNKTAFDAFERHGITAHICPIRHRYFWDGGVHCSTLDLHREGVPQDFFPDRTCNRSIVSK